MRWVPSGKNTLPPVRGSGGASVTPFTVMTCPERDGGTRQLSVTFGSVMLTFCGFGLQTLIVVVGFVTVMTGAAASPAQSSAPSGWTPRPTPGSAEHTTADNEAI